MGALTSPIVCDSYFRQSLMAAALRSGWLRKRFPLVCARSLGRKYFGVFLLHSALPLSPGHPHSSSLQRIHHSPGGPSNPSVSREKISSFVLVMAAVHQ